MKRYTVTDGIVIRRLPLPSGDLVVTLLSESGKWRAVARKGKLPGGNLGRLSLFHDVTVQYYRRREDDLALLTQVTLNGALPRLTEPGIYPYAHLLAELVDDLSVDVHLGESVHAHLASALRGLNTHHDPEAVALLYSWRLLALAGLAPRTTTCSACGGAEDLSLLDVAGGALVCERCSRTSSGTDLSTTDFALSSSGVRLGAVAAAELRTMLVGRAVDFLREPPLDRRRHWLALKAYLAYHVGELASLTSLVEADQVQGAKPAQEPTR